MKQISILALVITGLMLPANIADAARGDRDGLKRTTEKSVKAKGKKRAGKAKKSTAKKKVVKGKKRSGVKKTARVAHKKKKTVKKRSAKKRVVTHAKQRKKSKSRKFKRLLKNTLRALADNSQFNHYNYNYDFDRRKHAGRYRRENYDYAPQACLPRYALRQRLVRGGWHDFELINRKPNKIRLKATNFNGRRFLLVLDSCDGHVLKRRPVRRYWGGGY